MNPEPNLKKCVAEIHQIWLTEDNFPLRIFHPWLEAMAKANAINVA